MANLKWLRSAWALTGHHSAFSSNLENDSTLSLRGQAQKENTLYLRLNEYLGRLIILRLDQRVNPEPRGHLMPSLCCCSRSAAWHLDIVTAGCQDWQTGQSPSARWVDLWGLKLLISFLKDKYLHPKLGTLWKPVSPYGTEERDGDGWRWDHRGPLYQQHRHASLVLNLTLCCLVQ